MISPASHDGKDWSTGIAFASEADRLQAVFLNSEGRSRAELAEILKAPRSKVLVAELQYEQRRRGSARGIRSGRPARLDREATVSAA